MARTGPEWRGKHASSAGWFDYSRGDTQITLEQHLYYIWVSVGQRFGWWHSGNLDNTGLPSRQHLNYYQSGALLKSELKRSVCSEAGFGDIRGDCDWVEKYLTLWWTKGKDCVGKSCLCQEQVSVIEWSFERGGECLMWRMWRVHYWEVPVGLYDSAKCPIDGERLLADHSYSGCTRHHTRNSNAKAALLHLKPKDLSHIPLLPTHRDWRKHEKGHEKKGNQAATPHRVPTVGPGSGRWWWNLLLAGHLSGCETLRDGPLWLYVGD